MYLLASDVTIIIATSVIDNVEFIGMKAHICGSHRNIHSNPSFHSLHKLSIGDGILSRSSLLRRCIGYFLGRALDHKSCTVSMLIYHNSSLDCVFGLSWAITKKTNVTSVRDA